MLATASEDHTVRLWDAQTGKSIRTLKRHTRPVLSIVFSPDGRTLPVLSVVFSPDGRTLANASEDETIRLWDVRTGVELRTMIKHQTGSGTVMFSPDGSLLVSNGESLTVRLWDVRTGESLHTMKGHIGRIIGHCVQSRTVKQWQVQVVIGILLSVCGMHKRANLFRLWIYIRITSIVLRLALMEGHWRVQVGT